MDQQSISSAQTIVEHHAASLPSIAFRLAFNPLMVFLAAFLWKSASGAQKHQFSA